MALYRANYLSDAGINRSPPIPNLQKKQVGVALDYSHIDEFGRPRTVYSWNRNIHDKDFATDGKYATPQYEPRVSGGDLLKLSAAQQQTKAYKDALEFIKAEQDYRAKERYLDRVTPSRRGNPVTTGTGTSTSGLPIPDQSGIVYNYPAEVRATTGMVFQAPAGGKEPIDEPSNANSKSPDKVILTKETEIRQDPLTGLSHINVATGSVVPLDSQIPSNDDIPMPGTFPSKPPSETVSSPSSDNAEIKISSPPLESPIPQVVANSKDDPNGVADIIESNFISTPAVSIPAHGPFRFKGRDPPVLAGKKRKAVGPPPIPRLDKKRIRTGESPYDEVASSVPLEQAVPGPSISIDPLIPGTKRPAMTQPDERQVKKKARTGASPSDVEHVASDLLTPGTKRPAMRQPDERQVKKKARTGASPYHNEQEPPS